MVPLLHGVDGSGGVYQIFRVDTVDGFADADAVGVVAIGDSLSACRGGRCQLSSLLPGEGVATVGQRVTDGIVGDGLAVIGGQQVLPGAVTVGIGDGLTVYVFAEDITSGIVGIGGSFSGNRVHIRFQTVQRIVGIGSVSAGGTVGFGDGSNIAVVIVGVGKACIATGTGGFIHAIGPESGIDLG